MSNLIKFKDYLFLRDIKKYFFVFIAVVLFLIPFFWFSPGEIDLGGDSSRLYFFDVLPWLKNIAIYSVNTLNSVNTGNPNFFMIPFLLFLYLIRTLLGGNSYMLNCFFSGLLLSGSFIFTYLSLNEIINTEVNRKKEICAIIGGLFFVFSPLVIDGWMKALYSFNQILIYPLVFFLLIKYLKSENLKYIYGAVISTLLFSVNFSFHTFPWFFAFFLFSLIFLLSYSYVIGKTKVLKNGFILFIFLFLTVQSFQLIPQIANVLSPSNPNSKAIFSNELAANRGLQYFLSVQPYVRLTYNLLNQAQLNLPQGIGAFDYGLKYRHLYYIYILIVIVGGILIRRKGSLVERKIYSSALVLFLILAFFMTANITQYLASFYKSLFSIPGFSMYRSFYSKFGMTFAFFYAILFSLSLSFLWDFLKFKIIKTVVALYLFSIIIFNGWPLLSGMIVNSVLWQSDGVKLPTKMSNNFINYLNSVRERKLDGRYLTIPLTNEEYQIVQGENGGAYFGPSIASILAGKNDFVGFGSFNIFSNEIVGAFAKKDWGLLKKYLTILNIRYITHNSDDYIYFKFPSYPYATVFKNTFPTQDSMRSFIKDLGYQQSEKIGYMTTSVNDNNFLPHIYIPETIYLTDRPIEIMSHIISQPEYQLRSAVYFTYQNSGKSEAIRKIGEYEDKDLLASYVRIKDISKVEKTPLVEFKKINPTKYRIRIHRAKGVIPIVFSDIYEDKWQIYLSKIGNTPWLSSSSLVEKFNQNEYKIINYNKYDQADLFELESFIKKGIITEVSEGDPPKFISKNFQGTIQNDNLPDGFFSETWSSKSAKLLSGSNHLQVNGYANSWVINTDEICIDKQFCIVNQDGSFDFEIVLEFWQQRLFYYGLVLTGLAVLISLTGLFFSKSKNNNEK